MVSTSSGVSDWPKHKPPTPYEFLRDRIVDGSMEPGTVLTENAVAEMCGVSRTPAREALGRLHYDGLLQRNDRGLLEVRARSPEEILDIYETRIALEEAAARHAAERRTQTDRFRLEALTTVEMDAGADPDELARVNREFHRGVWQASHNESVIDLLNRLNLHLMRYPATTLAHPGRWAEALDEHRRLVDAILEGDSDRAGAVAREHFTRARDIRILLYRRSAV